MARSKGRSRAGVTGKRVAPAGASSPRTARSSVAQCDPFRSRAKPRRGSSEEKSTPSLPPGTYDDAWPRVPSDPYDQGEQESILSEGEEVRPRRVERAERGGLRSKDGRLHVARPEGTEPRDRGGGLSFADRPLDKPIASARPLTTLPLHERGPRRRK